MAINRQNQEGIFKRIFDGIPSPIFVVDEDVQIHEYNTAAATLLADDRSTILRRRAGEVLHCLHARDVPGCGRSPFCEDCIIRDSVNAAFQKSKVVRRRHKLELIRDGNILEIHALITASAFLFHENKLVLLLVEDIGEIMELQRLIPICAKCKKIRSDEDYWVLVESYFKKHFSVDFSHGLCPCCYGNEMDSLQRMIKDKQSRGSNS